MGGSIAGRTRWLGWIWPVSVVLISISSLVPVWISIPRTGMVPNFVALLLLSTLLPVLWRVRGGVYVAIAGGLSALSLGGSLSYVVVAVAFERPESFRWSLQWGVGALAFLALFVHSLRRCTWEVRPRRRP